MMSLGLGSRGTGWHGGFGPAKGPSVHYRTGVSQAKRLRVLSELARAVVHKHNSHRCRPLALATDNRSVSTWLTT